ncbi:MAG: nitrous oxide reductase family maturation protein NosD [Acidimicrobiales bacterium]
MGKGSTSTAPAAARALRSAILPITVLVVALAASGAGVAGAATPRASRTLWVAPANTTKGAAACRTAPYHSIASAITAAGDGDTVIVCAGTYRASTTITTGIGFQPEITTVADIDKSIVLIGRHGATIDAAHLDNGVTFFKASDAEVEGFSISGALGEGVLALRSTKVTIADNVVTRNDKGSSSSSWSECEASGNVPNDCGEGIHLMSTSLSKVLDNTSEFNAGGILLSDDLGSPTEGNTVSGNLVEDNESDCGITVVGHSGHAVNAAGHPTPKAGGVFGNTIGDNVVISNGTNPASGELGGGGILFASGTPGGGAYDNSVTGNEIAGNGLSGITVHQHFPLSDLSGDVFSGNWIGTNDILGDPGTGDSVTTGVLLDNGGTGKSIKATVTGNTIAWDTYGIYDDAGGLAQKGNVFLHVTVHVKS